MAETSSYIGSLISQSFSSLSSLLSMWGGWGGGGGGGGRGAPSGIAGLLGSSRRVADVLLVLEDLEKQRLANAERLAATEQPPTPRRGERIVLTNASITSPDGKCLASELSVSVESSGSANLLISGGT